jgi:hypothetical protein
MSPPNAAVSPSWLTGTLSFFSSTASKLKIDVNHKDGNSDLPPRTRPSNELYDLVLDRNWHRAVRHCREQPIDAEFQDGDTMETPLYLACQNHPPVELVRALLRAFPAGAETPSRHGDLPLHIACRYHASIEVLRELVLNHPGTVGQSSKWGETPVTAFWEGRETIVSSTAEEDYSSLFWQKMQVLLEALATSRQQAQGQPTDTLFMVHAVVALGSFGCPIEVLEYVLESYPEQVSQTDGMGRLPLHICVGPAQWSHRSRRKYKPREKQVIVRLLELYPPAARTFDTTEPAGRYPLHTALAGRHQWKTGVKELFEGAPEAIFLPDPVTRVYPFQLASIPVRSTAVDLDTIYNLLRVQPPALERAHLDSSNNKRKANEQKEETEPDMTTTWLDHKDDNSLEPLPIASTKLLLGSACALLGSLVAYSHHQPRDVFVQKRSS